MSSLDRMLTILDLFDESRMSIQLEHAVQATGASKATAYRYLQSLCNRGLLAPAAEGSYVLGPRIIELDRLVRKMDPLLTSASPMIRAAAERLGVNIMLCSFYGDKVMCADLAWPDRSVEEIYERGRPMPLFRGAMAKIILANLTPYQLRSIMLWHGERIRDAGLGDNWDDFRSRMTKLRRAGFCVSRGEVFNALVGISAPIFDAEQRVLGSVVFVVPEARYDAQPDTPYQDEIVALAAAITADIAKRMPKSLAGASRAARPRKARLIEPAQDDAEKATI
ncbi:MAG: IclR family transcriptional regulator C-terminal domain-containing protein [Pseudomonadota bacterium]|jgi:DNA-binding IclR family transcriptional regulator